MKIQKISKIAGPILLGFQLTGSAQSPSFLSYTNPVIPGDHPDCTLTKIGKDYYTTGSSFNPTPVIYHSTDLVHWEAIAQPVSASWEGYDDKPGGGCWGGQMVRYNGMYWDFFSRDNTMYFVKAEDPKGPWSDPVKVDNPTAIAYGLGYDNSLFIDDNNKWYLVVKNGQPNNGIVELDAYGQPTGLVYDLKWLNPGPAYQYSWAEGPVIWKYKGYYYYSFARDVAGGQKVMRSRILTADQADWEMLGDFFNENDSLKAGSRFTGPNHASSAVVINDNTSWVMHPVYVKDEWKGQGRQGLLNQVHYDADLRPVVDYPINTAFTAPKLPGSDIPWMVPKSDFFDTAVLHPEWSFVGYTPKEKYSLTERPGWLKLSPKSEAKGNTIVKNDAEHNYSLITRLDFNPINTNDEAGLWIMRGDETKFVKLISTLSAEGKRVIAFGFETTQYQVDNTIGDILWLKMVRVNHQISAWYSKDGYDWSAIGQGIDISVIDAYSDFTTWAGTRQGLYVQGRDAFFDLYIYRDAYTPIMAENPANQIGTTSNFPESKVGILDDIHPNDWALYAGVEFGNKDYPMTPDSVEFTASSIEDGGSIQVWLDAIDTGTKIAECAIGNTGSWTVFQQNKAAVTAVSGSHDVYLKFTGTGTNKLFQLRWIKFNKKTN